MLALGAWPTETTCGKVEVLCFTQGLEFVDGGELDGGWSNRLEGIDKITLKVVIIGVHWGVVNFCELFLLRGRGRRWRVIFFS